MTEGSYLKGIKAHNIFQRIQTLSVPSIYFNIISCTNVNIKFIKMANTRRMLNVFEGDGDGVAQYPLLSPFIILFLCLAGGNRCPHTRPFLSHPLISNLFIWRNSQSYRRGSVKIIKYYFMLKRMSWGQHIMEVFFIYYFFKDTVQKVRRDLWLTMSELFTNIVLQLWVIVIIILYVWV